MILCPCSPKINLLELEKSVNIPARDSRAETVQLLVLSPRPQKKPPLKVTKLNICLSSHECAKNKNKTLHKHFSKPYLTCHNHKAHKGEKKSEKGNNTGELDYSP